MVRLPGYGDRKPGELSGGQRQRVALARAIVNRPKVLLLDEPLGALDLKLREQMQVELKTIQGEVGITFVYVTHDQDEALTMSDRIAVFNEGRIEQVSPPRRALRAARPTSSSPASSASPTCSSATASGFTIRPEKIQLLEPGAAPNGLRTERGRVADVAYAGMVTRYTVALDAGGELQLVTAERGGRVGGRRRPSRGRRSWWAGARSTRSPSVGSQQQRRNHREERTHTPPARRGSSSPAWSPSCSLLAGCGSSDDDSTGGGEELQKVGKGEGEVDLISWAGYVEPEWTKPFEQKTGCKVNNKVAGTSDEMVQLMRTGQYDGVSASGNASARLVDGGDVDPVNVDLVPNYETIFADLKDQPYNTFDGVHYGIPHGRGANLLMWNTDDVKPAPDLLGRDPRSRKSRPNTRARSAPTTTRSTSPTRPST